MIYHCPSATPEDSWIESYYSYGQNEHMYSYPTHSLQWYWVARKTKIKHPSKAFRLTDAKNPCLYNTNNFSFRHSNGINILYVGGNCSWMSYSEVQTTASETNYQFWYGRDTKKN